MYTKIRRTTFFCLCLVAGTLVSKTWAQTRSSELTRNGLKKSQFLDLSEALVNEGLYYSAIPLIKEYLAENGGRGVTSRLDSVIDKVIYEVGVRQFETLPQEILVNSQSPSIKYIRAKKFFRLGRYEESLSVLQSGIPRDHPVKPFALNIEGSIHALKGQNSYALEAYRECIVSSERLMSDTKSDQTEKQLEINRDLCLIGKPRVEFAGTLYQKALEGYSELPKESYVWPMILFEEAWTSFYDKTFNRTLGKLVSYKAPIMNFYFNPEVHVLRALTYMKLCLWNDAKMEVDEFYANYAEDARWVRDYIGGRGKDYDAYYNMAVTARNDTIRGNRLLARMLTDISRETAYLELMESYRKGKEEIGKVKSLPVGQLRTLLLMNLKRSLILQRSLIGAYVRRGLILEYGQLFKAFEGMSYIKLEVLSGKKQELYTGTVEKKRGDIKYLSRKDNQYFWNFNGEWWADELGDYIFTLKSECNGDQSE